MLERRLMYRVRPDVHVQPAEDPPQADRRFPFRTPWFLVPVPGPVADIPEYVRICPQCDIAFARATR